MKYVKFVPGDPDGRCWHLCLLKNDNWELILRSADGRLLLKLAGVQPEYPPKAVNREKGLSAEAVNYPR